MRNAFYLCALWLLLATSVNAQEPFEYAQKIEALVEPYLENEQFSGVSIGIVLDGMTWTLNYGQLSPTRKAKPSEDTVYEIGSISKVFTSILLADAVLADRVQMNQTIGSLMPQLQDTNGKVGEKITLKHLSQHMSGLPSMPTNFAPKNPNNPFAGYDHDLLVEYMKSAKLQGIPGTMQAYSNLGAGLLGDLLARQDGKNYESLLKDRLLTPLKMNDTTIKLSENQKKRLAPPQNSALLPDHKWDFDALAGAGAISSTTKDMIQFIKSNLDPPENSAGKAIDKAWQQQLSASPFGRRAMGLGWMIAGDGTTRWHNGQTGGYHSMLLINRDAGAGVILLTNTADMGADELAKGILNTILGKNVEPRQFPKRVQLDPAFVKRLAGKYQLSPTVVIHVTAREDKLMVQLTGQQVLPVYPESPTVWNYRIINAQLHFEVPENGNCTQVALHQNGQILQATRIED